MTRNRLPAFLCTVFLLVLVPSVGEVSAVPSYARKYRTSCATCHNVYPQLNAFGRLFLAKGYRMPGLEKRFVRDPQVPLGDPTADRLWPRTIYSSDIPGSSVASFLVKANLNTFPDRDKGAKTEFDGIEEIGLILGGTVGKKWSFFGDIDLFEDGEPGEIGRLFVQWNHSLALNLRTGLFEPRAVPISNHRRLIRTTSYLANTFPVVAAHNFFGFSPSQKGIEGFGRIPGFVGKGEFGWAVGVVNGEPGGVFEVLEETESTAELIENLEEAYEERGRFDFNDQKDVYANLDYEVWLRGSFTFGAYYYRGTTGFLLDAADPDSFLEDGNSFRRWGGRFRWEHERGLFTVLAAAAIGKDRLDRPALNRLDTRIYTVEFQWFPFPWFVPALRFETVDLDDEIPMVADRFTRYTMEVIFLPQANVKIALGATRSSSDAPDLPPFEERYRVALVIAF
ncbi:MAG: hypothetical protein O7F16_13295 [Acidobacteria bacterium]|nr:hypothetical protein [Acidobacteriota bacterium]